MLLQMALKSERGSVVSDFLTPWNSRWNSLGQNTGVGSSSLLQRIFPTQGLNPDLLHCKQILYQLSHQGSPALFQSFYSLVIFCCMYSIYPFLMLKHFACDPIQILTFFMLYFQDGSLTASPFLHGTSSFSGSGPLELTCCFLRFQAMPHFSMCLSDKICSYRKWVEGDTKTLKKKKKSPIDIRHI